jgi:hypothetical protein
VLGGLGTLLWWGAGSPQRSLLALFREQPTGFDALLVGVAAAIAWLCLCWFGLVVALQLIASGSGAAAVACRRFVRGAGPPCMLGAARWLVGATLLAGPLTSGVATAAQSSPGPTPAGPAAVLNLDRPTLPNLDRPLVPAQIGGLPTPAGAAAVSAPDSSPPARSAPTTSTASRSAASLLTGHPHREPAESPDAPGGYVVRGGDTLWDIAARHLGPHATDAEVARAWPRWYAANRAAIGVNPQLIHPGLVLRAPTP